MSKWIKEIHNEANNTYAWIANFNSIEAAFLNRSDFDTDVWKIRFDKDDYDGNPKILGITEEALKRNRGFKTVEEVMEYLKIFISFYLKSINYDFNKIPQKDIITSEQPDRLPKLENIGEEDIKIIKDEKQKE